MCDTSAGAIYGYNSSCSNPGSAGKSTTFNCTPDFGNIGDVRTDRMDVQFAEARREIA